VPTDTAAPRFARPAYILGAASLFVPILETILLPDISVTLFVIVGAVALLGALAAITLGILTVRATQTSKGPGRLDGIFGILLGIVAVGYNGPLLFQAVQVL
jgi:hypothetical protein